MKTLKWTLRNFRTLIDFCIAKNFSFFLFDNGNDRFGDGDKNSYETFDLRRPRFLATRHLKTMYHEYHVIATKAFLKSRIVTKFVFCKFVTVSHIMQETFLHHNIGIFNKIIKSKVNATMGTFLDFAYFNSYLQTKETA